MSKELPYFKFNPGQWLSGDITLESMEVQGVFINVCSLYWSKECRLAIAPLSQRYGEAIARLLECGIIKEKEGFAVIEFLDEQWSELYERHKINSKNGLKGNEKRWGKSPGDGVAIAGQSHLDKIRKDKIRKDNTLDTPTQRVVVRPTLEEVKAYCIERKNAVDPQRWFDHYTSNGWRVGKNPMKDWRAAVRTWEKSSFASTIHVESRPAKIDKAPPPLYSPKN